MVVDTMEAEKAPSQAVQSSPDLVIVADDLTGACDTASAFTQVTDSVRVRLDGDLPSLPGISVVCTSSRDLPRAEAASRLTRLASVLPESRQLFKKIDSVFRGNTFTEIATSLTCFPADLAVLAPAFPQMGRRMRGGTLHVEHPLGNSTIAVEKQLRQHGCDPVTLTADMGLEPLCKQMRRAVADGSRLVLVDAWHPADLDLTVSAVRSLRRRILWIGSGGLGHALAACHQPLLPTAPAALRQGRTLFFIGSDHATTRGQVAHLQRMSGLPAHTCDATPSQSGPLLFTVPRGLSPDSIQNATSSVATDDLGCLFLTGGDTALAVCSALGITSLRIRQEFAPGIPLAIAEGGRFDGVPIILKSGAFGERDLLCRILDTFAAKESVASS